MSSRSTNWVAAVAWLGAVALAAGVVIWLRTARMNDYMSDDGNPVIPFAILFMTAILIPLAGVQRSRPWSRLAAIQAGVVVAACLTLFAISPSGDGLYILPIAIAAIITTATSLTLTIRARHRSVDSLAALIESGSVRAPVTNSRRRPLRRITSDGPVSDLVAEQRR